MRFRGVEIKLAAIVQLFRRDLPVFMQIVCLRTCWGMGATNDELILKPRQPGRAGWL